MPMNNMGKLSINFNSKVMYFTAGNNIRVSVAVESHIEFCYCITIQNQKSAI